MDPKVKKIIYKAGLFILSISMAWYLVKGPLLKDLLIAVSPFKFLSEFIAGMLYASFLTSPISIAIIAVLAKGSNPILVAMVAGLGAAFSDFLIVRFFRDHLSQDINFVSRGLHLKKINDFLTKWKMDFIIPLTGAIIVASPLPDEMGLVMLGVSKLKYSHLAILTYILNTAGILIIVLPFNLIS